MEPAQRAGAHGQRSAARDGCRKPIRILGNRWRVESRRPRNICCNRLRHLNRLTTKVIPTYSYLFLATRREYFRPRHPVASYICIESERSRRDPSAIWRVPSSPSADARKLAFLGTAGSKLRPADDPYKSADTGFFLPLLPPSRTQTLVSFIRMSFVMERSCKAVWGEADFPETPGFPTCGPLQLEASFGQYASHPSGCRHLCSTSPETFRLR